MDPTRAGKYVRQPDGYRAFIPAPLPPDPPVAKDSHMERLVSDADWALGRLDGAGFVLPNPDLFVAMYVRQEAVLSSQIEGTQSTLEDVLQFEADTGTRREPRDVEEVVNYVCAMNHGLKRLGELPLSLRLIRETHAELLRGARGGQRDPGHFRNIQNWIGPRGCTLADAEFVPPPPAKMHKALDDFERFLQDRSSLPALIHCALAHAQFETKHPFLDGNGRIGRLLVTLLLCERSVLYQPLLYLSYYLKAHRQQYYDRLMAIRNDGDWEGWIKFFLRGVYHTSHSATATARAIFELREGHRALIGKGSSSASAVRLLDYLFEHPIISVRMAERHLGCTYVAAANAVNRLERAGVLRETTGAERNRRYRYDDYLQLFAQQATALPSSQNDSDTSADASKR